jgi:putative ATP-dependent endonuclease of the OLD family
MNAQLATATRAAREAFRESDKTPFKDATARAEELGKHFSVPVRDKYAAELDIQGALISSGGVALHDGNLPLRTLGSGSARLIVSALQHNAGGSHIALVDEVEHGLEPHRIARLLKYLSSPLTQEDQSASDAAIAASPQVFMTSHSPVVIRELKANNIFAVRSSGGSTSVQSIEEAATDVETAQRHLRSTPEAFLARRVLIGEGKTECGLFRGLDACWSANGYNSYAYQGVVAINGEGIPKALTLAKHLINLGYDVGCVLDSDQPPSTEDISNVVGLGVKIFIWPDSCSTEQRLFLDLPWETLQKLVTYVVNCDGEQRTLNSINSALKESQTTLNSTILVASQDTIAFRRALGAAAKSDRKYWFHDIERAENVANLLFNSLDSIKHQPLASTLVDVRKWIDG